MATYIQQLAIEISNDPAVIGYAALITTPSTDPEAIHKDQAQQTINQNIANALNLANIEVHKTSVSTKDMLEVVASADLGAVSAVNATKFGWLMSSESVDPFNAAIVKIVQDTFGAGSATVTALNALRRENISRAKQLGWSAVEPGHVAMARIKNI